MSENWGSFAIKPWSGLKLPMQLDIYPLDQQQKVEHVQLTQHMPVVQKIPTNQGRSSISCSVPQSTACALVGTHLGSAGSLRPCSWKNSWGRTHAQSLAAGTPKIEAFQNLNYPTKVCWFHFTLNNVIIYAHQLGNHCPNFSRYIYLKNSVFQITFERISLPWRLKKHHVFVCHAFLTTGGTKTRDMPVNLAPENGSASFSWWLYGTRVSVGPASYPFLLVPIPTTGTELIVMNGVIVMPL